VNQSAVLLPSPVQRIAPGWTEKYAIDLFVKRDDLIHPFVSGNKWRKLAGVIEQMQAGRYDSLLTFGGAFSNHIHATASAGSIFDFRTVGFIRGESDYATNFTLSESQRLGMRLEFVDRATYRQKTDPEFLASLALKHPKSLIIPEGGSGELAYQGLHTLAVELISDVPGPAHWIVPVGSAGTFAGLVAAAPANVTVHGISVLKDGGYLREAIAQALGTGESTPICRYHLHTKFGGAGYAKFDSQLIEFMTQYWIETGIRLEPIYSGKAMSAINQLVQQQAFEPGTKLVFIHTGGMQGLHGLKQRFPKVFNHEAFNI